MGLPAPHTGAAAHGASYTLNVDIVLLRRLYLLFFITHGTRRVHLAGMTVHSTGSG